MASSLILLTLSEQITKKSKTKVLLDKITPSSDRSLSVLLSICLVINLIMIAMGIVFLFA